MAIVTVLPYDKSISVETGVTIANALREHDMDLNIVCGGKGSCGKCKIKVVKGSVRGEKLENGMYLACKTTILEEDLIIDLPQSIDAVERKSSLQGYVSIPINLAIQKHYIKLPKPSLADQRSDWERLIAELPQGKTYVPIPQILVSLPTLLRDSDFEVTVVLRDKFVISVEKGNTLSNMYGVAFDIGTTSVVASLIDLNIGKVLCTRSQGNPQRIIGADVISRIEYSSKQADGMLILKNKITSALNDLIDELIANANVNRQYLYEATIVGNTTMHHLLLGINSTYLAQAPYIPSIRHGLNIPSRELGLNIAVGGDVYILPNIAGFVGSDTVAVILSTEMYKSEEHILAIDVGTNGEIALGSKHKMLVCSTAAGPALEGANISCGMRAAVGAIESVKINENGVDIGVIGKTSKVKGICGSGLIQCSAEMLKMGIINSSGRLIVPEEAKAKLPPNLAQRIQKQSGETIFVLVAEDIKREQKAIFIGQKDIREMQLAKGAIAAGIKILMKELKISLSDLKEVLLAGTFGSYIDKESAIELGLVPLVPSGQIRSIGNAAGLGALRSLISTDERLIAEKLAVEVESVELSSRVDFQSAFVESLAFEKDGYWGI